MGRRPAAVPEPSLSCVGLSRGLCGGEALMAPASSSWELTEPWWAGEPTSQWVEQISPVLHHFNSYCSSFGAQNNAQVV